MVFSSIVFLCMFLPLVVAVYFLTPKKLRNIWLLVASLFFYGYGEPIYIGIMLFSTVFDYCNGRMIAYFKEKGKGTTYGRGVLVLSLVGNLGILGFFKYTDFAIGTINQLTGSEWNLLEIALPIGISFYTFQTLSYTIDVYRGKVECQKNILDFGMYVCLFPQLIAGPIVRYEHIAGEIKNRKESLSKVSKGLQRFCFGLGKKVLIANQVGAIYTQISGLTGGDRSMAITWLGALAYTFQIYFDFSGYSDMAIGLGMIFGFRFPENFNYPYESKSVTEFWRRWHMTLGSWFREYVYIPLGGNRKGYVRQLFNLFLVWFLTGLWHGAGWNFVLWGLYYFVLLLIEKTVFGWQKKRGKVSGNAWWSIVPKHIYTLLAVVVGWVLFSTEDLSKLQENLQALVGSGVSVSNQLALFAWRNYLPMVLLSTVATTSIPSRLARKVFGEDSREVLGALFSLVVLGMSVAFLISGSYNPFLYFRF